jgi:hypothetical protein
LPCWSPAGGSSAAANGYDEFLQGRAETIDIERDGLRDMLEAVAVARETDAEARRDHRYAEAARNIRLIASTLHQVDNAVMVDVAMINEASDGMASKLITARLLAIGFELPPVGSAAEFFAPFDVANR